MVVFMRSRLATRRSLSLAGGMAFIAAITSFAGCERKGELETKVVFGRVTCEGEPAEAGWVRFYPVRGTKGPASKAILVDSEFRIEHRGGVPTGWHRIEVEVQRKTGRKVRDPLIAGGMTDEFAPITPMEYATEKSPLTMEITASSDGELNFDIPQQK